MTTLSDKSKNEIEAIVHNHILILPSGEIIGVIIGHCVFDRHGVVRAKYFTNTLYDLEGKILAKRSGSEASLNLNADQLLNEGWKIISVIKDLDCPKIHPANKWSAVAVREHFGH